MTKSNKNRVPALAYLRTLSAANVGTDKDSEQRQRHAIQSLGQDDMPEVVRLLG